MVNEYGALLKYQTPTGVFYRYSVMQERDGEYHGDIPENLVPPRELGMTWQPSQDYVQRMEGITARLNNGEIDLSQVNFAKGTVEERVAFARPLRLAAGGAGL